MARRILSRRTLTRLAVTAAAPAVLLAATAGPAAANGAVANSCGVPGTVVATTVKPRGLEVHWLRCGDGIGNVTYATVKDRPFLVRLPGRGDFCMEPGQRFYPHNAGNNQTAVLIPVIRCRINFGE